MALPLTTPPGSTFRLFYRGPLGVAGMGAVQTWDLTGLPDSVREDPTFKDNFRIFVKQLDPMVMEVGSDVDFFPAVGIPDEIALTFDSSDANAEVDIEFWYIHSLVR